MRVALKGGLLWPLVMVVPLLIAAATFDSAQAQRSREEYRSHVASVVGLHRARIEHHLATRLHQLHSLAAFVRTHQEISGDEFGAFAREMIEGLGGIRALQLAPRGVVTHVVPREGNEDAIGHDLLADPTRSAAVRAAIERREIVLAGPYHLRQGGEGLVGRLPIFVGDGDRDRFWGLAIIVLDAPELWQDTETAPVVDGVRLAIRGRDGSGEGGETFFGSAAIDWAGAVRSQVILPTGAWEIGGEPEDGWPESWPGRPAFAAFTFGLALLVAFLSRTLERRTRKLRHSVAEAERNERLMAARLRLADLSATNSLHELLVATLDEACGLTGGTVGFYHFLMPDQVTLSLQAWSTETTRTYCKAVAESTHYDVDQAGVWADAVRQGRSVVYNDYAGLAHKRGLPAGHAEVMRVMSIPIFRNGRIRAIIGVGNKPVDFDADDLAAVETLADLAWDLTERKRAEDAVVERAQLVQRRYEALRSLNTIAALPSDDLGRLLAEALALGARHLGLPLGIVSRIEGDSYTVLHHHAPPEAGLRDGQSFPLGDTYCAITLDSDDEDVVAIAHMGQSGHRGHPCYQAFHLEAYIGVPIQVGGRRFGTVNFSSPQPYPREFDDGDLEFMRLLARWVGSTLERAAAEAEVVAAKEAAEEHSRQLAASNAELEQFAYVASHDLRQPLRMVSSYLTLIERTYGDRLDGEGREFLAFACHGAQQMDRLIRDLLEYSRVGRNGGERELVDLAELAAEAGQMLEVLAAEAGCRLAIASRPAPVLGNRSELVRLFQNIIGNGIKYRAPDRPPQVSVDWRAEGDDWLVTIRDNGIGIPEQYREEVFRIFRRLHTSEQYEGTGIGLAICQKVVTNHGGRIWIDSDGATGTAFLFTLPRAEAP